MPQETGRGEIDLGSAECGLTVLVDLCNHAIEDVGATASPAQLRALLVLDQAGSLNLNRLARALAASASAVSRLLDRMQAAGLVSRRRAATSRREILVVPTESGQRLARWVRGRRRAAIAMLLERMTADGGEALARGLGELADNGSQPHL